MNDPTRPLLTNTDKSYAGIPAFQNAQHYNSLKYSYPPIFVIKREKRSLWRRLKAVFGKCLCLMVVSAIALIFFCGMFVMLTSNVTFSGCPSSTPLPTQEWRLKRNDSYVNFIVKVEGPTAGDFDVVPTMSSELSVTADVSTSSDPHFAAVEFHEEFRPKNKTWVITVKIPQVPSEIEDNQPCTYTRIQINVPSSPPSSNTDLCSDCNLHLHAAAMNVNLKQTNLSPDHSTPTWVPTVLNSLVINTVAGKVESEYWASPRFSSLSVESVSGSIHFPNLVAPVLNVNTVSSEAIIEKLSTVPGTPVDLKLKSVSGYNKLVLDRSVVPLHFDLDTFVGATHVYVTTKDMAVTYDEFSRGKKSGNVQVKGQDGEDIASPNLGKIMMTSLAGSSDIFV